MNLRKGNELIEGLYSSCCDKGELLMFHFSIENDFNSDRDGIGCPFCGKHFKIIYNNKISKVIRFIEDKSY